MTKQERIEIIVQLLEAGQTKEGAKQYLIEEAKWELSESTLDKYIAEASQQVSEDAEPDPQLQTQEEPEQEQSPEPENEQEDAQESEAPQPEASAEEGASEDEHVEMIKELLEKGEDAEELKEGLAREFDDEAKSKRLVTRSVNQLEQAKAEALANEQQKELEKFNADLQKHLDPARKNIEKALDEIGKIKKKKQKAVKSTHRFRIAEKILRRLLKNQLSRV